MRNRRFAWVVPGLAACALIVAGAGQAGAELIDTTSGWDGKSGKGKFGENKLPGNVQAWGQTFTVGPTDKVLDSFTVYLNDFDGPKAGPVKFTAGIAEWDGKKVTGPVLWKDTAATTNNGGKGGMEAMTFDTGGLALDPGKKYVAIFTVKGQTDGTRDAAKIGVVRGKDAYKDGAMVYLAGPRHGKHKWRLAHHGVDAAFTAEFSENPVPEGITLALIGGGSLLGYVRLRRRRGRGEE